jgi:serine/threonine-protein kinase
MNSPGDADRNLLFGMLALQNGLIGQVEMVAAFQAWTMDKARSLADHLVERGGLDADDRAAVDALVLRHLKKHGGSTAKSLAALPAGASTRRSLERVADPDLGASLAGLGTDPDRDSGAADPAGVLFPASCVTLTETDAGPEPVTVSRVDPALELDSDRYELIGEIARGGMGVVLRGRDPNLGRDLALKLLLDRHRGRSDLVERFIEEAQICGQLQHPGVVPVYELGTLRDRRPFFTMKLVKGRTLAALLSERASTTDDLPRFLSTFEAVCQTVAYAHARGVIHRDLKPSNVMVGSFGEVQVMDWGLAKVLPRDGQPTDRAASAPGNETVVATARTKGDSDLSQAGSVLGTPAYMAPEQARGETEAVDRRADVFALGSILCEILTGTPAFQGPSSLEILRAAGRADTTASLSRLSGCGADEELVALARDCLAAAAEDRPADAGVVAERLTAYLAGVQERLRETEVSRAAETARAEVAEAKAAAERRARWLTAALAATVLLAGSLGAAGWRWMELQRLGRIRAAADRVNLALQEATRLRGQAQNSVVGDLAAWPAVLAAAGKARDLLVEGIDPALRKQVEDLSSEIETERTRAVATAEAAERDRRIVDRLADIRSAKADDRMGDGTDASYAEAFREARIDPDALSPEEASRRIKDRPPETATAMAMAMDDWAAVRRDLRNNPDGAKRLTAAARLADPDPWRSTLRDALEILDRKARRERLIELGASIKNQPLPPVSFDLLGRALGDVGAKVEAESILRRGRRLYPGDVWLNYDLARALEKLARREEAVRYYTAARIIRPETAHELAHALEKKGENEEAIGVFRDLAQIRPGNGRHLACLGSMLLSLGLPEASQTLTEAIAVLRTTIAEKPGDFYAHLQLGNALHALERYDEALATYREAARLNPGYAPAFNGIGSVMQSKGRYDEAIEAFSRAIRLDPEDDVYHYYLSYVLRAKSRLEEALSEARESVRLSPDDPESLRQLANCLGDLALWDEAEAAFRRSLAYRPDNSYTINSLAWNLVIAPGHEKRDPTEALALARRAVQLAPQNRTNVNTLGVALYRAGLLDEAITTLRRSAVLNGGKDSSDWFFLAMACYRRGELNEAAGYFVRGIHAFRNFRQDGPEYATFWAEASDLFGALGPGPSPFLVKTDSDRAMAELRRAVAAGNLERKQLSEAPTLELLRSRPDFRLLVDQGGHAARPDDPARAAFRNVAEAYAKLESYSDHGRFVACVLRDGKVHRDILPHALTFVRPNRLDLVAGPVRILCDGKTMTTVASSLKRYSTAPAPEAIRMDTFRVNGTGGVLFGGPAGAPAFLLLNLLAGTDPDVLLDEIGGTLRAGESDGARADGSTLRIDFAEGPDLLLRIDPAAHLLSAVELKIDPARLDKSGTTRFEQFGWEAGVISTRPVPGRSFAFVAPEEFLPALLLKTRPGQGDSDTNYMVEFKVNRPAPPFVMTLLDGPGKTRTVTGKELEGKVVVIDFWATWCGPCLFELPEIQKVVKRFDGREDVLIVALSQDGVLSQDLKPEIPAARKLVENTLASKAIDLTSGTAGHVGVDPSSSVGQAFDVEAFPTLLVLDRKGIIRSVHVGYSPDIAAILTTEIDALLAGRPVPGPIQKSEKASK